MFWFCLCLCAKCYDKWLLQVGWRLEVGRGGGWHDRGEMFVQRYSALLDLLGSY